MGNAAFKAEFDIEHTEVADLLQILQIDLHHGEEGAREYRREELADKLPPRSAIPVTPQYAADGIDYFGPQIFLRNIFKISYRCLHPISGLRVLFTARAELYDSVCLNEIFTIPQEDLKLYGFLYLLGDCSPCEEVCVYENEVYVPKNIGARLTHCIFLDGENRVLSKGRGIIFLDDDLKVAVANKTQAKSERERQRRMQSIMHRLESDDPSKGLFLDLTDIVKAAERVRRSPARYIVGRDEVKISYRKYAPTTESPKAIIIYVSLNSYFADIFAERISQTHPITAMVCEIRGYGHSGGKRGVLNSREDAWQDIRSFVRFAKLNYPNISVFLMSQHIGSGMALNYDSWDKKEPVDGYIFISPNLGHKAMKSLSKTKTMQPHFGNIILARLSRGHLKGTSPAMTFHFSDAAYELNPMIVDTFSTNLVFAAHPLHPRKQLASISIPICFVIPELDEIYDPDELFAYTTQRKESSEDLITRVPGEKHMGIFLKLHSIIGPWVMQFKKIREAQRGSIHGTAGLESPVYATFAEKAFARPISTSSTSSSSSSENETDLADMFDNAKYPVEGLGDLFRANYESRMFDERIHFIETTDQIPLAYRLYRPKQISSTLILFEGAVKAPYLQKLADQHEIAIFCFDMRGAGNSGGKRGDTPSRKHIWADISLMVKFVKFNNPDMPIFLGGIAVGAAVVLNYATWKDHEPVHGLVFISPWMSPKNPVDSEFLNAERFQQLFQFQPSKGLFSSHKKGTVKYKISENFAEIIGHQHVVTETTMEYHDALYPKNTVEQFRELDTPFCLFAASNDSFVKTEVFCKRVTEVSKAAFREIRVVPDINGVQLLMNVGEHIGAWIPKVISAVLPSFNFRLNGSKLEDFQKIAMVGKGANGKVYLAKHIQSDRYLALKCLSKAKVKAAGDIQQVILERDVLSKMSSPWVVPYIGSFQDKDNLYLMMAYQIGGELFTQIKLSGKFDNEKTKFYAAELVLFLEYVRERGLVYRDLKPENILLDSLGHLKVTDFGMSKLIANGKTKSFCGTPQYIAPEVLMNQDYDYAVDVWSLGVLIFEMLTGNPPFMGKTQKEVYRQILYSNIEFPKYMDPDARDMLKRMLNRNPVERLGTGKGGLAEIKRHKWWKGIDWGKVERRQTQPPFVPHFTHDGDTGNFIHFSAKAEKEESVDEDRSDWDQLFQGF